MGKYEEALEFHNKAIELGPFKNCAYYLNKADTLIKLNRYLETIEILNKQLEIYSNDAKA